ncbi:MAG: hypothetical protein AAF828_08860, partial [Bacteroidota bacterium]
MKRWIAAALLAALGVLAVLPVTALFAETDNGANTTTPRTKTEAIEHCGDYIAVYRDGKEEVHRFMMPPESGCPDPSIVDLLGVTQFPQTDSLAICGGMDTISILVAGNASNNLGSVTFTVDLPVGLEYAGYVENGFASAPGAPVITEGNVTNVQRPEFNIGDIPDSIFVVVQFGVTANCDAPQGTPLNIDITLDYNYVDDMGVPNVCTKTFTPVTEYNTAIRRPVLNILATGNNPGQITELNTETCQTVTIGQNGLRAVLDEFNFTAANVPLDQGISLTSVNIISNGASAPVTAFAYDAGSMSYDITIGGADFQNVDNPVGAQNDLFEQDESIILELCYTPTECANASTYEFVYSADYDCEGVACQFPTQTDASLTQNLTSVNDPQINVTLLNNDADYCGTPAMVQIELSSSNNDPVAGLFKNLRFNVSECSGAGFNFTSVTIDGVTVPNSIASINRDDGIITVDLRTLPIADAAGTNLVDDDTDGFADDLPGDQTTTIVLNLQPMCGAEFDPFSCNLSSSTVSGTRNCNQAFTEILPVDIDLQSGNTDGGFLNEINPLPGTGLQGYDFGQTGLVNGPGTPIVSSTIPVDFEFNLNPVNLTLCGSGATYTIEYKLPRAARGFLESLTITNSGPGTGTVFYDPNVNTDSLTYVVTGAVPGTTQLQLTSDWVSCAPPQFYPILARVTEECTTPCACERTIASDISTLRIDPEDDCVGCILTANTSIRRFNYGFTDETMTTPVDPADVSLNDSLRFLPNDTALIRVAYTIENANRFNGLLEPSFVQVGFGVELRGATSGTVNSVENVRSKFHHHLFRLQEFKVVKTDGTEIRLGDTPLSPGTPNAERSISFEGTPILQSGGETRYVNTFPQNKPGLEPLHNNLETYAMIESNSANDFDDNRRFAVFINRNSDGADVVGEFLTANNLENGDQIVLEVTVPLVDNPGFFNQTTDRLNQNTLPIDAREEQGALRAQ